MFLKCISTRLDIFVWSHFSVVCYVFYSNGQLRDLRCGTEYDGKGVSKMTTFYETNLWSRLEKLLENLLR